MPQTKITVKSAIKAAIFTLSRKNGTYLYPLSALTNTPQEGNISIPLNIDTEYKSLPLHWLEGCQGRKGITTQVKGIGCKEGKIFSHSDFAKYIPRHLNADSGFHAIDYLRSLGYSAEIRRCEDNLESLPTAEFVLYAFFALAELTMICDGEFKNDIVALANESNENKPRFEMMRRLRCVTPGKRGDDDSVAMPWVMRLEGIDYRVKIAIMDAGALHGISSYQAVCEATGIKLEFKDNFTSAEKADMDRMAIERPLEFDPYGLGDLYVYDVLLGNAANFGTLYQNLGLTSYFTPPKLTIGSTIKNLFGASLQKALGIKADDRKGIERLEEKFLEPVSAGSLKENSRSTAALAAKVDGGRCRNNRPLDIHIKKPIVDLDISGCYGEGQRNQDYYVGSPEILEYASASNSNRYWTLREWLKAYDGDLVPGAWFARVSTLEPLKNPQDYSSSWFLDTGAGERIMSKYVKEMPSDSESESVDYEYKVFNVDDGTSKIFYHEILNGVLTQDGLEWIQNIASRNQRNELLDKLLVKTSVVYPASWKVGSYEELLKTHSEHTDKNTKERIGLDRKKLRSEDGECHAWYSINIGTLLIDDLLANRKLYKKKTPLNTLYKLCVNTLYGDMTSKFFMSANVVVGNNITARARALAWYMEKGLYGFQTITDGCAFELNRVVYPRRSDRRVTGENLTALYRDAKSSRKLADREIELRPLGGYQEIKLEWLSSDEGFKPRLVCDGIEIDNPMAWIDNISMEHLRNLFPKVSVLHGESSSLSSVADEQGSAKKQYKPRIGQFSFEGKDFYDSGTFHGTANYCLENPNGKNLKFRAYETKKPHESVNKELKISDRYSATNNPAKDFISQLSHPESVIRQDPFVKDAILKLSDYKNRLQNWTAKKLLPGDSFYKPGHLREFSLSQMTFNTLAQYQKWNKTVFRLKEKFGQSLETYFINDDGTLNYAAMIVTLDRMIADDVQDPLKELDKNKNAFRDLDKDHPMFETYSELKRIINVDYKTECSEQ